MRKTMILLLFSFLLVACSDSPVCYYLDATGGDDNNSGFGKGLIQGTSQYIAKKMRTVKVHLKAGYRVMLYQEKY